MQDVHKRRLRQWVCTAGTVLSSEGYKGGALVNHLWLNIYMHNYYKVFHTKHVNIKLLCNSEFCADKSFAMATGK